MTGFKHFFIVNDRRQIDLSLDKVARLTDISKSILGPIEREEINPSISTV